MSFFLPSRPFQNTTSVCCFYTPVDPVSNVQSLTVVNKIVSHLKILNLFISVSIVLYGQSIYNYAVEFLTHQFELTIFYVQCHRHEHLMVTVLVCHMSYQKLP